MMVETDKRNQLINISSSHKHNKANATKLLLTLTLLFLSLPAKSATFHNLVEQISIQGDIVEGDYNRLIHIIKSNKRFPEYLNITSNGGNVIEAIKIGRLARKAALTVNSGTPCNSAYFLVSVGGVERYQVYTKTQDGWVGPGIHRPYYDKKYFSGLTYGEARKKHSEMDTYVKNYLKEMGVSSSLIDKMMSTPSDEIFYLDQQLYDRNIGKNSAAFYEWVSAKCGEFSNKMWETYQGLARADSYKELYKSTNGGKDAVGFQQILLESGKPIYEYYKDFPKSKKSSILRRGEQWADCKKKVVTEARQQAYNHL